MTTYLLSSHKTETGEFRAVVWEVTEDNDGAASVFNIVKSDDEYVALDSVVEHLKNIVGTDVKLLAKCEVGDLTDGSNAVVPVGNHFGYQPEFVTVAEMAASIRFLTENK